MGSRYRSAFIAKIGILLPRRPWQMAGKLGGSSRRRFAGYEEDTQGMEGRKKSLVI
jgi:hypothetical protein